MYNKNMTIEAFDDELWQAMLDEEKRQEEHIELIASENYVSPRVLAAAGSVLTNKYAEGYPGKRYYGGCAHVDRVEALAIARAKELFGADYANVQPHSGSQANAAVYLALLEANDTVLGMSLPAGGHLTHGSPVNFSGRTYHAVSYGLDEASGEINYAEVEHLAHQYKPKLIIAGFSAYSGIIDWAKFRHIADSVDAYLMADIAHIAGLVAVGLYPSPIGYADVVTTTTHKTLRGPRGGLILARANADLEKKLKMALFPGTQGGPLMHIIAAKAVAFKEAQQPEFKMYQQQVLDNAHVMVTALQQRDYNIVSGGTKNHLFLLDLMNKEYSGKDADLALGHANITTNKNTVPNDRRSPFVTSGVRVGTPAITTRGFKVAEARQVADWIADVLDNIDDEQAIARVRREVVELCHRFPLYRTDRLCHVA